VPEELAASVTGRTQSPFLDGLETHRDQLRDMVRSIRTAGSIGSAFVKQLLVNANPGAWPCWFDASDTSGEKEREEFEYPDEPLNQGGGHSDGARLRRAEAASAAPGTAREEKWLKEAIGQAIPIAVPELVHIETNRSLDERL
jgi:hypothetical protein